MDDIVRISSSAPWEPIFGYSRAVRAGDWVAVSGSTGLDENGQLVGRGQIYVQARQAISNIAAALGRLGLGLERVVRTRVYVTELDRFGDVARAHQEMFGAAPPASTVVQIARLVHPDMLIEIEADAYAGPAATTAAGLRRRSAQYPHRRAARRARARARPRRAHGASRRAGASAPRPRSHDVRRAPRSTGAAAAIKSLAAQYHVMMRARCRAPRRRRRRRW